MNEHYSEFGGNQSATAVHMDIVTSADVLNVYWDTCILEAQNEDL